MLYGQRRAEAAKQLWTIDMVRSAAILGGAVVAGGLAHIILAQQLVECLPRKIHLRVAASFKGGSEVELQRELNLPWSARCQGIPEPARTRVSQGINGKWIELQGRRFGADRAKLSKQIIHMVEQVEEFRAEFETFLFVNGELFLQSSVPSFVSRALDDVAPGVAMCSKDCVVHKRAGVEQRSRDAGLGVGIADHVGT